MFVILVFGCQLFCRCLVVDIAWGGSLCVFVSLLVYRRDSLVFRKRHSSAYEDKNEIYLEPIKSGKVIPLKFRNIDMYDALETEMTDDTFKRIVNLVVAGQLWDMGGIMEDDYKYMLPSQRIAHLVGNGGWYGAIEGQKKYEVGGQEDNLIWSYGSPEFFKLNLLGNYDSTIGRFISLL